MLESQRTVRRFAWSGLIVAVFAVDAFTPLAVNVPILYLLPLLLAFLTEPVRWRVWLTVVASVLTAATLGFTWKWQTAWQFGLFNRVLDVGVFWGALALSVRDARTTSELRDLRHALDYASIVSIFDRQGVIRHVNDRACQMSKYSRDELIGRDHRVLNSGIQSAGARDVWSTIGAGRIWHREVRNTARDGSVYWVDMTVVPFLNGQGRPYQFMAIYNDISAQKRAEARLRSQAALAKIGEMAAIVAHEVRNPLAGVRGGLQLFEARASLTTAEQGMIRQMMDRLDLLNAHVSALLHFARPRTAQIQAVAIRPLLDDVVRSLEETGSLSGLTWEVTGDDAQAFGDRLMLREVCTQLLLNAAEAQPEPRTGTMAVTVESAGDTVELRFADTGPGIPASLRERVFEPLFTTKPNGSGLGLAIARQLIELQGGEIEIAASSPSGTTIRVALPRVAEGASAGDSGDLEREAADDGPWRESPPPPS